MPFDDMASIVSDFYETLGSIGLSFLNHPYYYCMRIN